MLKNYKPAEYTTVVEHVLVFDDGYNNGFRFPCDYRGRLLESEDKNPTAYENLRYCMAHPEKFERFDELVTYRHQVKDNARGTCICGSEVELWDQYYGACQCPNCKRWYNLFGQELLPPERWETDPSEEEWQ